MTTEVDALQTTLDAEHAAVYVYGLLGSRTSQGTELELYTALRAAYEAHRQRRDTLIGEVAATGATPNPAAPAYTPPPGLDTTNVVVMGEKKGSGVTALHVADLSQLGHLFGPGGIGPGGMRMDGGPDDDAPTPTATGTAQGSAYGA